MSRNRDRVQKFFSRPSLTKQSFKDECDVNLIMKRFNKIMGTEFLTRYQGHYGDGQFGDFSEVADYRTAFEQVDRANVAFEQLPAKIRYMFSNDPAKFLDFVSDPKNVDQVVSLGLATKSPQSKDAASQTVSDKQTPVS